MRHGLTVGIAGAAALSVALYGCGTRPPKPVDLQTRIEAQQNVNPDGRGRASPVVVRVYELKSLAAFNTLDYFTLFDRDKESLGSELLEREEMILQPGSTRTLDKQLQPGTRYIGVVAAFRNLERAQWRSAIAVPEKSRKLALVIRLDKTQVAVSPR